MQDPLGYLAVHVIVKLVVPAFVLVSVVILKVFADEMIELSDEQLKMVAGDAWWGGSSDDFCSCDGDDCLLTPGM